MHEMKLTVNVHVFVKPTAGKNDFAADYRRMFERNGTYLGERDLGDTVVIYEAQSHRDCDTIRFVSRGLLNT